MAKLFALSTTDNKFNPITHYREWWTEDRRLRHNTQGYLASVVGMSSAFSDDLNNELIESCVDYIVERNDLGKETNYEVNYIKVVG